MMNKMLNWKSLALFLLGAFVIVACEQEELSFNFTDEETAEQTERRGEFRRERGERCFKLVFPVTIEFPDGSTQEVADREAYKEALKSWKEANPDAEGRPTLAFPYDVELADGTVESITGEENLEALKETCKPERERRREKCFELVFPVTIVFPDGSTQEVADRAAYRTALKDWKEANPDAEGRPTLAFPYEVTLADSTTTTISSEEDLEALKETCKPEREKCFEFVYPLTVAFPDGTTESVENAEALEDLFEGYKEENPEASERPEIQLPYDVTFDDGTTKTISSAQDMLELKKTCGKERRNDRRDRRGGRRGN